MRGSTVGLFSLFKVKIEINVSILWTKPCRILDDIEMYEQQKPFTLNDYISMSSFINQFLFTGIMSNHFGEFSNA